MQDSPTRHKSRCCAYTIVNLVLTASTYARLEEKMAPRTNITLLCFALALLSVIEAMDIIRSNERADTKALNQGIPDVFPCKGPSRFSLDEANTKMLCGGKLCLVQCKAGYKPFTEIPFVYVCHTDGLWTSIPFSKTVHGYEIEWPICYYNDGF